MITTDFWYHYSDADKINRVDWTFYPNDGLYRGNLYIGDKIVGDYTTDDSTEIMDLMKGEAL